MTARIAAVACSFVISFVATAASSAATFDANFGGIDLTIVEADPFASGQEPGGNTQRVDGSGFFWSTTTNSATDGLWFDRAFSAFATPYTAIAPTARVFEINGADEDTFGNPNSAPALRTTVTGLTSARYEVFLLYLTRHDGHISDARTYAELNAPVTSASTLYDNANATVNLAGTSVWDASIASLGIIDNATEFFVEVAGSPPPESSSRRADYLGVAYRVAPLTAVPGDFDSDGDVDGADFVAWQTNFPKASNAVLADGDADADGDVDGADFVVWQTNFPFTPSSGMTPIPEPSALVICGIALLIGTPIGKRLAGRRARRQPCQS